MNSYGKLLGITIYGESHGHSIGGVITGFPAGVKINYDLIKENLARRKPRLVGTTKRIEKDDIIITSGIFEGFSTGMPIHFYFENNNITKSDYELVKNHPRPNHADFVAQIKYHGFNDHFGGGHFSGRLTAPLVAMGSFAQMITKCEISSQITSIGSLNDLSKMDEYLLTIKAQEESVGGTIQLKVTNLEVGLGEPFFHKLDAELSKMLFSIPAVKGVVFGNDDFTLLGSQYNDVITSKDGLTKTNNSGGVVAGISNGNDLIITVYIKPTPSIKKTQETFNLLEGKITPLTIDGRHDIAIVRRIGVVLESVVAIVIADFTLIKKAYENNKF